MTNLKFDESDSLAVPQIADFRIESLAKGAVLCIFDFLRFGDSTEKPDHCIMAGSLSARDAFALAGELTRVAQEILSQPSSDAIH